MTERNDAEKAMFSIIYNVTINIENCIAAEWFQWLIKEHIPNVMATHCFTHYHVLQILNTDESEGLTYAIQYFASSIDEYEKYILEYAEALRKKSNDKWGDAFVAFRTVMKKVECD